MEPVLTGKTGRSNRSKRLPVPVRSRKKSGQIHAGLNSEPVFTAIHAGTGPEKIPVAGTGPDPDGSITAEYFK